MDSDERGLLNFSELVKIFDLLCRGDGMRRLKLLFLLHVPPLLVDSSPRDCVSPSECPDENVASSNGIQA
jgi:hypothetical protein